MKNWWTIPLISSADRRKRPCGPNRDQEEVLLRIWRVWRIGNENRIMLLSHFFVKVLTNCYQGVRSWGPSGQLHHLWWSYWRGCQGMMMRRMRRRRMMRRVITYREGWGGYDFDNNIYDNNVKTTNPRNRHEWLHMLIKLNLWMKHWQQQQLKRWLITAK